MNKPLALIIEDDPRLADIFSETLRVSGYTTQSIMDGAVAAQKLKELSPYLIILDLHLPNVLGTDLFKQIKADPRLNDTYIIVATADPVRAQEIQADSDLVLLKPISVEQLRPLAKRFLMMK